VLQTAGWRQRTPLGAVLHYERWGAPAHSTWPALDRLLPEAVPTADPHGQIIADTVLIHQGHDLRAGKRGLRRGQGGRHGRAEGEDHTHSAEPRARPVSGYGSTLRTLRSLR
jgi:hypothetical protein